jgi:hypothetical protein
MGFHAFSWSNLIKGLPLFTLGLNNTLKHFCQHRKWMIR